MSKVSPIGSTWDDFEREHFTSEEIAASELRASLIVELIKARNEKGISISADRYCDEDTGSAWNETGDSPYGVGECQ